MPNSTVAMRLRNYIPWLINDEFNEDLVAGTINTTPARPTGGLRTVVDTTGKVSLSGGKAIFAAGLGTPAWTDPKLSYPTFLRVAGMLSVAKVTWGTSGNTVINFGSSAGAGQLNGLTMTWWSGVANVVIGTIAYSTLYYLASVLRSTGCFILIKGGTFIDWALLWVDNITTFSATPTPGIANFNGVNVQVDFLRIPCYRWLPTPLASDSFNRANGPLGNTDGAGHFDGNGGGSGLAWTNQAGTIQVSGNAAIATATVGGIAIATVQTDSINVLHEAAITLGTTAAGIVLRYAGEDSYVYALHNGTNAQLHKVTIAGGDQTLINIAATYVAGKPLRVIPDGTSFSLFYNNAKVGTTQTISDAELQTSGAHGLYFADTDSTADAMVTWERAGAQNQILDQFIQQ